MHQIVCRVRFSSEMSTKTKRVNTHIGEERQSKCSNKCVLSVPNLGMGHLVIDRKQWGSSELADKSTAIKTPLKHPVPYVLITHVGVQSRPCNNVYNCSIKMRTLQDSSIAEKRFDDLPANFYVSV